MVGNIILLSGLFLLLVTLPLGFLRNSYEEAIKEAQKETYSYIESIKKETQSNKEIIIVDWKTIGNAPREVKVEFEKDMIEKKYRAESNHNNIVVYKKISH